MTLRYTMHVAIETYLHHHFEILAMLFVVPVFVESTMIRIEESSYNQIVRIVHLSIVWIILLANRARTLT